ncbi:MAG TPA: TlpA disulfide reductase family protein, partial [Anaerolineae bacterium]
ALNAASDPTPDTAARVGALAPDFTLADLDNRPVNLAKLRGQVVVLNFWATWCGPCREELGTIEKIRSQYADRPVVILGINQQEYADSVRGYADLYHLNFTMLLDSKSEVGRAYRVNGLPTTYFVDRAGIIRHIEIGGPMSLLLLQTQIGKLLGEGK